MNIIGTLVKNIRANDEIYSPCIYITAWDKWCIAYVNVLDKTDKLCSVCVEPENNPIEIENTIGTINDHVGNARSLDDATKMIKDYVEKNYLY